VSVDIYECTDDDYMQIANAITRFNMHHLPPHTSDNMCSLGYVMRDAEAGVIGGVYGKLLLGNCLSIDILWMDAKFRKHGYATQLMQALENSARKLGSRLSIVDTFDFQALGFYLKCNYELFGTLDDCPCPGNKRYYLKKVL
jgi:GNAT superfamily N-acetyltransferase